MDNVPADVVRAMGASRVVAVNVGDLADLDDGRLLAVRPGRRDARRDDAGQHEGGDQAGRHHHQRAARRLRLARLAPQRRAHRRGLQGRRVDARPAAAARGQRGGVRAVEGRPPGPPADRASGPGVRPRRRLQLQRRAPPRRICSRATSASRSTSSASRPTSRSSPASTATRPSPGAFVTNAAGESGLLVEARPKPYGPPFLMLGLNLENTTSEDFRITLTGRYLALRRRRLRL